MNLSKTFYPKTAELVNEVKAILEHRKANRKGLTEPTVHIQFEMFQGSGKDLVKALEQNGMVAHNGYCIIVRLAK